MSKNNLRKSLIIPGVIAIIIAIIGISAIASGASEEKFSAILVWLAIDALLYIAAVQIIWGASPITDIIITFMTKPFSGIGLIFELSLDGIIWFILVKLGLMILSFVLSIVIAIFGVVLCMLVAPFSFPFALREQINEIK